MKNLNNYISEAWSGVKKHTNNANIEAWCEEMRIENYTINSKGEIDVSKSVYLSKIEFKELPYKFGKVDGCFDLEDNKNLISLKNCPNEVEGYFSCSFCPQLDSLKGCPKEVYEYFSCGNCKQKFTEEEVRSLCSLRTNKLFL